MTPTLTRRATLAALAGTALATGARAQATGEPTGPQPKLPTQPLTIGTADGRLHHFAVEVARTPREQEVGLMFRHAVAPDGGMLFVWPRPQVSQLWMENTLVPLDMVFINDDGTVGSIAENTVPQSLGIISSGGPAAATLELQGGLTSKLNITVGDKVSCKALQAA